jgi:hypothetical protein
LPFWRVQTKLDVQTHRRNRAPRAMLVVCNLVIVVKFVEKKSISKETHQHRPMQAKKQAVCVRAMAAGSLVHGATTLLSFLLLSFFLSFLLFLLLIHFIITSSLFQSKPNHLEK